MNVPEQVAKLMQVLPLQKQAEVLDFVEFLVYRQSRTTWTVEKPRDCRQNAGVSEPYPHR
jgi:hypothetical protein